MVFVEKGMNYCSESPKNKGISNKGMSNDVIHGKL